MKKKNEAKIRIAEALERIADSLSDIDSRLSELNEHARDVAVCAISTTADQNEARK